jgi:hypothetical protein
MPGLSQTTIAIRHGSYNGNLTFSIACGRGAGFVSNRRHEDLRGISIPVEELLSDYT